MVCDVRRKSAVSRMSHLQYEERSMQCEEEVFSIKNVTCGV